MHRNRRSQLAIGFLFISASALASSGHAASVRPNAEYLGGTVKTIQPNTTGTLDLDDAGDLQFKFGDSDFRIPYSHIRNFLFSNAPASNHKVGPLMFPSIPGHHSRILDISYRDESGSIGTVSLRVDPKTASSAEWKLGQRVRTGKELNAADRTKLAEPESWWGDKFWRTNRNKTAWPEPATETGATSPTATK